MMCEYCNEYESFQKNRNICKRCYTKFLKSGYISGRKIVGSENDPNSWQKDLLSKKGSRFIKDLYSLKKNPFVTLKNVGDAHGITKERVRQIYKKYFGEPYTIKLRKKKINKNKDLSCLQDPRNKVLLYKKGSRVYDGAISELEFMNKCMSLGYDVGTPCSKSSDVYVNGFKVEVKSRATTMRPNIRYKTSYYGFFINKSEMINDFYAFHIVTKNVWFILPRKNIPKSRWVFINAALNKKSKNIKKYIKFFNNFSILGRHISC